MKVFNKIFLMISESYVKGILKFHFVKCLILKFNILKSILRFYKRFIYIIRIEYIYFGKMLENIKIQSDTFNIQTTIIPNSWHKHENPIKQNDHISKYKWHFSNSESAVDLHIECDACIFHTHNVKLKHFKASALRNEIAFIFSSGHTFKIVHNLNTIE